MKRVVAFSLLILSLVFASTSLHATQLKGRVMSGSLPLEGVVVTDGENFTKTGKGGKFVLESSDNSKFVYLSVPSGYSAPVDKGVTKFFIPIDKSRKSYDFHLIKKEIDDNRHGFIAMADPQIYSAKEFALMQAGIDDIKKSVSEFNIPFHGICAGDLISHDHNLYPQFINVVSSSGIPFFHAMGNHDMVVNGRSFETTQWKFEQTFGPSYYSFNVGKIHYVVLNNCFFIGRDYFYIGYLEERQLRWLEKDLSYIPKGSTIVLTVHIPTTVSQKDRERFTYERAGTTMANHRGLYKILEPYNAHIISGHTHTNHNQTIKNNLFEHVTAALSGAWWQGELCTDGTPRGYGVYTVAGDSIKWYYKSTGYPKDYQMRVYTEEDDQSFKGYVVANVWNYDPLWRVELYENGVSRGVMSQFEAYDPAARAMYSNRDQLEHKWIYPSLSDKFFRAKPESLNSQLKVVATDRFGNRYESSVRPSSSFDVVIVGGGTSGTSAGIRSGSMGVRTLIIEEHEWLGGMLTSAGVSAVDGNHKLRGALWGEFRDSLERHYGGAEALKTGWVSNTLFEPSVGNRIFKNIAARYPKLHIWYRSSVESIRKTDDGWEIKVNNRGVVKEVNAKVLIDATELGDIAASAGVTYDVGMDSRYITGEDIAPQEENDIVQDLTYAMILKEYNRDMTIKKPEGYNPALFYCSTISKKCTNPKEKQRLWDPQMMITYGKLPNNKYMINWPIEGNDYYLNLVEKDPATRALELKKAKEHSLSFLYYIQTELGFNRLALADDEFPTSDLFPFIPYHRESRRVHGVVRFTINHITDPYSQKERLYRTAIAVGDYPVDHHHTRYEGWESLPDLHFYPVPSYGLPLGTLIPQDVKRLIVAEKSISVTNLVNGTTRLQPVVLQIGEAAGTLAALSVKKDMEIDQIPVRDVQREILKSGGYLLPFLDIPADHKHFKAIQRVGVTGIIKGVGKNAGWENQTWFYIDSLITNKELIEGALELYIPYTDVNEAAPIFNLSSFVNSESLSKMFSYIITDRDSRSIIAQFKQDWSALGLMDFSPSRPLTRLECAVLIDKFLDPFNKVPISIKGEKL